MPVHDKCVHGIRYIEVVVTAGVEKLSLDRERKGNKKEKGNL